MILYTEGVYKEESSKSPGEMGISGGRRPILLSDVYRQERMEGRLERRDTTTDGSTATNEATSGITEYTETTVTAATSTTAVTTSLVCSTEKETSVTSCDATSTYDCSLVAMTTSVCRDGLYCTTDTAGNHLCMVEQDGLTTSGTIVTVILAVILATIIGTISTLCIRDRMERKRRHAKVQAVVIAKDNTATEPLLEQRVPNSQFSFAPVGNTALDHHPQALSSSWNPFSG